MALVVKNLLANAEGARDVGSVPGLGKSSGGGHGNPLQYSCLEDPKDRRGWQDAVHRVSKGQPWLKWLSTHFRESIAPVRPYAWCYLIPRWNLSPFFATCFRLQPLTGSLPLLNQTTTQEWLSELSEADGQLSKWQKLRNTKNKLAVWGGLTNSWEKRRS